MQNDLKAPGFSGIFTDKSASLCSPISALSATKRKRSKLIFAPDAIPIKFLPCKLFFWTYDFKPAAANAPAGSKIVLVSSKPSLIAAHT